MSDIVHIQIPEAIIAGRGRLGRHIHLDARSAAYPAQLAPGIVSVKHQSSGLPLTQTRGSCTAEATCGALNSVPHWAPGQPVLTQLDADSLYNAESILQGSGPVPPNDPGGSGTEVCQAALNAGMLCAYEHASGIGEALLALVVRPVITGVNWFTSFDTPDPTGLVSISPGATVRGGHEILADEIDAERELVWFWNSWGPGFGAGGRFCMTFATWSALLSQGGDVTVPRTAPGWVAQPLSA